MSPETLKNHDEEEIGLKPEELDIDQFMDLLDGAKYEEDVIDAVNKFGSVEGGTKNYSKEELLLKLSQVFGHDNPETVLPRISKDENYAYKLREAAARVWGHKRPEPGKEEADSDLY